MDNTKQKAMSVCVLIVGMLIFAATVFSHVDAWSKKEEAELKLFSANIAWQDYRDYSGARAEKRN